MSQSVRIFISSTWEDLRPEREAVEKAIQRLHDTAFVGMEYFGSRPETPRDVSLAEVDRSAVYVGIFAHRYGSGITEDEYRRAVAQGLPCLLYVKDDNTPVPPAYIERDADKAARLEALKRELKQHHTLSFFNSPDNLAALVVADLHNLLSRMTGDSNAASTSSGSTYHIHIEGSQGIAIGDGARVTQDLVGGYRKPDDRVVQRAADLRHLRLDAAVPEQVGVGRAFALAVAVRQITSSVLSVADLTRVMSDELNVKWPDDEHCIKLQVHVNASDCTIQGNDNCVFSLRRGEDSPVLYFHLIPNRAGEISIIVRVDQGQDWLGSTRVRTVASREGVGQVVIKIVSQALGTRNMGIRDVSMVAPTQTLRADQSPRAEALPPGLIQRLRDVAKHITEDYELLREYEEAYRLETDPKLKLRDRRAIEEIRQSVQQYQVEYNNLRTRLAGRSSRELQAIQTQLDEIDNLLTTFSDDQLNPRDE